MATTTLASNVRRYVCRETSRKGTGLLAGNCSISLTESEEKINVSHKSPKMFKLLQKAFTSSCRVVVIRSFSQNFLLGAPASPKCNLPLSGHLYIRELKRRRRRRRRRRRQRERQKKAIGLDWQNNNFARASRLFIHLFTVTARLRRLSWQKQHFTHSLRSFVNIVLPLENKIHIFAPPCNILYKIYYNNNLRYIPR